MLEVSPSKERVLKRLWMLGQILFLLFIGSFLMESSSKIFSNIYPGLENVIIGIFGSLVIGTFVLIAWFSSSRKILYFLIQERRIIFLLILLGILFYIDNIYHGMTAGRIMYPFVILLYISNDLIVMCFPLRVAFALNVLVVLLHLWHIFNHTFRLQDCKQYMLPWGIFGANISYCTVKRLIFQTKQSREYIISNIE